MDETDTPRCGTCADTGVVILPVNGDTDEQPCPTCRPWTNGFRGLYARRGGVLICLIHPAAPNERAIKHTHEERHEKPTD